MIDRFDPEADAPVEVVQHNIDTLMQIGGVYDYIAYLLEKAHADALAVWRLDHEANSVIDWLRDRQTILIIETET